MNSKVFVIGKGIISSVGNDPNEVYKNLVEGRSRLSTFDIGENELFPNVLVGRVTKSNQQLSKELSLDSQHPHSRTMLLGLYAASYAVKDSGLTKDHLTNTYFISANTVGGMDQTEQYFNSFIESPTSAVSEIIKNHDTGYSTEFIAKQLGLGGFYTTISTACSSSANSIMLGARMISSGQTDLVIAGGTDALCKFTLKGFNSLMLLSDKACKPFDKNRNGLNLGEGAGYVVLCSEKLVNQYTPIAELSGWGNANDAFHQTASSPEGNGAADSMKIALSLNNINPSEVNYINAHGTATPNNDLAEAQAILSVFSDPPPFSSTKPFTGHTLGAAGAIEAVISILSLQNNAIPPSLNFEEVMPETNLKPLTKTQSTSVNYVLSNSFGFGGNCSSLLFKKCLA